MRILTKSLRLACSRSADQFSIRSYLRHGRSAAYRRISTQTSTSPQSTGPWLLKQYSLITSISPPSTHLRLQLTTQPFHLPSNPTHLRRFHSSIRIEQKSKSEEEVKDGSTEAGWAAAAKEGSKATGEPDGPSAKPKSSEEEASEESRSEGSGGEQKDGQSEEKDASEKVPPPPHGDKTPWQVFTETFSTGLKESKEWNDSTKQLSAGYQEFTENPTLRKARERYSQASGAAASTTGAAIKKTAGAIGEGVSWTWDTSVVKGVRKGATVVGSGLEKVTRPVRETEAFKSVKETIDDGSSSRYGGWTEREERRKRREVREAAETARNGGRKQQGPMEENPDAGTKVTLHKDAAWKEHWRGFRDSSRMMQGLFSLKSTYAESENPLISTARSISDRVAGFFAENETAMVIKKFREMDPVFQIEPFLQEMREYILPEVLDAYVKGDTETLKLWLSTPQYSVYEALMKQYTTAGLKSDGRILDIRNVDIMSARLIDPGDIPVFIISCRTQEIHVYKDIKTNNLAAGMDDKVQQVTYAIGVTRIPEDVSNSETRGWRLIELQKSARDYI